MVPFKAIGLIAMIKISITFLVIFFIISCNAERITTDLSSEIPSDWVKIFAGNEFSFMAPPDSIVTPSQSGDSFTGSIKSSDFKLTFDYGFYSNSLQKTSDNWADYSSKNLIVDNKEATIVTYRLKDNSENNNYFIGIHFPIIKPSAIGAIKLTIECSQKSKLDRIIIEKIYKTLSFGQAQ